MQKHFVIVGQQPWDNPIGSNCINIAQEISKKHKILYVNPPIDRITLWRRRKHENYIHQRRKAIKNGEKPQLEKITDNLFVFTPMRIIESINNISLISLYNILNKRNNKIIAQEIKTAIHQLHFKDFILFNDGDMLRSFYFKELLKPQISIYYTRDYFLAVPYWKKHGARLEPLLMAKSDLVVSNSMHLNNLAKKHNPKSFYIGQGCEFDLFDPEKTKDIPADIQDIPHPRLGYVGALLNLRLDIELLESLATEKKEWQWVFIGPEDDFFKKSKLHQLDNVHFLGSRPMEQLAHYINAFDVALNPQKINEVTIGNYPRKIDEYLAMGKPTVATYTETMLSFKEYVYLAKDTASYINVIDKCLQENTPELEKERRAFALNHTWENSVGAMYKAIESL